LAINLTSFSRTNIKIVVENLGESKGELILFLAPKTVNMIVKSLPLEGKAVNLNGKVYFLTPIKTGVEKGKSIVEAGTLAYWPQANAFCIFYEKSKPCSQVNVVGKITENLQIFRNVKNGNIIKVEKQV